MYLSKLTVSGYTACYESGIFVSQNTPTLAPEFTPCVYGWRGRIAIGYPGDSLQPRVGIAVTPPAQPGEIPTVPAHLEEAQLPDTLRKPHQPQE